MHDILIQKVCEISQAINKTFAAHASHSNEQMAIVFNKRNLCRRQHSLLYTYTTTLHVGTSCKTVLLVGHHTLCVYPLSTCTFVPDAPQSPQAFPPLYCHGVHGSNHSGLYNAFWCMHMHHTTRFYLQTARTAHAVWYIMNI